MRDTDKLDGQIRLCLSKMSLGTRDKISKMSLSLQVQFEGQNEGQIRLFIENVPRDKMRDRISLSSRRDI